MLSLRCEVVEDGHAAGDSVFDLLVDEGAFVVHGEVAYFDAAVDGAGVHDVDAVAGDVFESFFGDAVDFMVFPRAGEEGCVLTFFLDAEEVDDVGFPGEGLVKVGEGGEVGVLRFGDEGAGAHVGDFGSEALKEEGG